MSEQANGELRRVLKGFDVLALGFGAMIGWGWIVLAGGWVLDAGSLGAVSAFFFGGIAMLLIGLIYAELASAMPQVGGEHVYSHKALGDVGSFVCTWAIVFGYASVVAFEAVALPTVVEYLAPNYKVGFLWTIAGGEVYASWVAVGVAGALSMTLVNCIGVRTAALLQKLVILLIFAAGFMFFTGSLFTGSGATMEPLFTEGVNGVFLVLIMVPFMFVGFDVIPQAAEEINLPFRRIGWLIIFSVSMAVLWYMLIVLGLSRVLTSAEIASAELGVPEAMNAIFGGAWAGNLMILAGVAGILTSWNAFLVGGSRAVYALARSGMLPKFLGRLHPRYNTPVNAVLLIGGASALAPLLGRESLVWFVNAGGLGIVIAYSMVALSFLVLRRRFPEMHRPWKLPMGESFGGAALILSLGIMVLYFPGSPTALLWPQEWLLFAVWMVSGFALFGFTRLAY
ncbi:MAG: APC family permease [Gammaproteobacteria bacterium]|nr:APC family permease [Gammaproteobacteria bacterium]